MAYLLNMNKPQIRLADNSEGEKIHALVISNGFTLEDLDWSKIYPYWLIAEHDGVIVGTIQVCPALPIGRIEMLSTRNDLSHQLTALTVRQLIIAASMTLRQAGAQMASGIVSFEMKKFQKILKKHGCVIAASGHLMMKRL